MKFKITYFKSENMATERKVVASIIESTGWHQVSYDANSLFYIATENIIKIEIYLEAPIDNLEQQA